MFLLSQSPLNCPIVQDWRKDNGDCLWCLSASVQLLSPWSHLAPITREAELLGDILDLDLIRGLHRVITEEPLICKYRSYWQRLSNSILYNYSNASWYQQKYLFWNIFIFYVKVHECIWINPVRQETSMMSPGLTLRTWPSLSRSEIEILNLAGEATNTFIHFSSL